MYKNSYPIPVTAYSVDEAPYVYTEIMEMIAKIYRTEDRTAGTIACFGGEPLQPGVTARAWLRAGYIKERPECFTSGEKIIKRTYRTKEETIAYFKQLAYEYEVDAHRNNDDKVLYAKADTYKMAAFELEHNMK